MTFDHLQVPTDGSFRLRDVDPRSTTGFDSKVDAQQKLQTDVARLAALQDVLYADDRWAVLIIFQAMDAAGKDGAIKHVMSGINPQGCQVFSFKAPSAEELDHDFMWRCLKALPERGRIGIFNRSYYEEVLIVRVHPRLLEFQKLPPLPRGRSIWKTRFEDINAIERYLSRNGVLILKFFLHLSPDEQKKRFLARLDTPEKRWKFSAADVRERSHWNAYMKAYEDCLRRTSTPWAPWHIIPADRKWYARAAVADRIVHHLEGLQLCYPTVPPEQEDQLAQARATLEAED